MSHHMLPHHIEAEQAVLGSLLIDPDAFAKIADTLEPHHFYRDAHRIIFQAIVTLNQRREIADYLTISDELERNQKLEQVGLGYLSDLINIPTSGHITAYAAIVRKKAMFRSVIQACGDLAASAYEEDEAVFVSAQERFYQISQGKTSRAPVDHATSLNRYWEQLEALHEQNSKGVLTGVPTGYKMLNSLLGGFRSSKLYILAARPGDGKTALALNFTYEAVKRGCQVLFFSIEMDEGELMQRLVSIDAKVDAVHLRDAKLDGEEWERVVNSIGSLQSTKGKLWTDDTPANDIQSMRAKARAAQIERGLDLIVVDYLQLAQVGGSYEHKAENRRLEVEKVSRELKEMARELKVPVLALAQLNRDVESRANRVPQLSDLREAGGIEQDCDVAMFIYRDPVIPKEAPEYDISLIIDKHRNGPKGNVPLHFVGQHTRFYSQEVVKTTEEE